MRHKIHFIPSVGLLLVFAIVLTVIPVLQVSAGPGRRPVQLDLVCLRRRWRHQRGRRLFALGHRRPSGRWPTLRRYLHGSGGFWQCTLIGDFSGNGLIDIGDIVAAADHWQAIGASPFDLDGDGLVTVRDVMLVASSFGQAG